MNKDLTTLQNKLEAERKVLLGELQGVGVMTDPKHKDEWQGKPDDTETDLADPNEAADRIESYEGNTALVQELEGRLKEIDHALKNMHENKYGLCEVCGKHIEEDRLNANPAARTCKEHINVHLPTPEVQ